MSPRRLSCLAALATLWFCLVGPVGLGVDASYRPQGIGPVQQFVPDPFDSNQGWAVTPSSIQFNGAISAGDRWRVQFTQRTFRRLTNKAPTRLFRFMRLYPSRRRRGHVFLMVQNEPGFAHVFHSSVYGSTWRYLGQRRMGAPRSSRPSPSPRSRSAPPAASEEETVDLGSLDESTNGGQQTVSGSLPVFKVYFDLMLHLSPVDGTFTFENMHSIILLDYIPMPGLRFSTEVNPSPRYYQVEYDLSEKFTVYFGKIQIPFGDMEPHNYYGGYLNNSRSRQNNAPAFLPDIWADLGAGVRWDLMSVPNLNVSANLYVVNGFGDGGTDPLGEASSYPDFGSVRSADNNHEKSLGGRLELEFFNNLQLTFSGYHGRYTSRAVDSESLTLLGVDTRFQWMGLQWRGGYMFTTVNLPEGTSTPTFQRGGAYGEIRKTFANRWYASALGGLLQTDDRVTDAGDQINVGGRIGYNMRVFDFSLQFRYDLKALPSKTSQTYAAFRAVVML